MINAESEAVKIPKLGGNKANSGYPYPKMILSFVGPLKCIKGNRNGEHMSVNAIVQRINKLL